MLWGGSRDSANRLPQGARATPEIVVRIGHGSLQMLCRSTVLLTVILDLTAAVEVGLVRARVFFVYRMSTLFKLEPLPADQLPPGVHALMLCGSLFFGAVGKIEALATQLPASTRAVVLEIRRLILLDSSGQDAM